MLHEIDDDRQFRMTLAQRVHIGSIHGRAHRVCIHITSMCSHHNSPAHTLSHLERQDVATVREGNDPLAGNLFTLGIKPSL